ncbi:hypothetical protein GCM10020256_48820 [Streptomyces thermocoprophilus]
MRLVGGGDDDEVEIAGAVEQLVRGHDDTHVRVFGAGLLLPLGGGRDHRVQGEALGGGDQRGVEDGTGEAVTDQADAQGAGRGAGRAAEGSASHAPHFRNAVAKVQVRATMAW